MAVVYEMTDKRRVVLKRFTGNKEYHGLVEK